MNTKNHIQCRLSSIVGIFLESCVILSMNLIFAINCCLKTTSGYLLNTSINLNNCMMINHIYNYPERLGSNLWRCKIYRALTSLNHRYPTLCRCHLLPMTFMHYICQQILSGVFCYISSFLSNQMSLHSNHIVKILNTHIFTDFSKAEIDLPSLLF
jgi:hypothetical protein